MRWCSSRRRSHARVMLHDPAVAALVAGLAFPATLLELTRAVAWGCPPRRSRWRSGLIDAAGMVET